MTAKELKASILDLSVRGKLVPQDPNDEPASVLLEKIRAEKRKLVKAGKIKKEKNPSEIYIAADGKPYEKFADGSETCIEDEIPFELPKGWAWARLGSIGRWGSGATPNKGNKAYINGDIPWLLTGDLNDGHIFHVPNTITKLALGETAVRINPIGSVLIAMYGATIGKLGILDIEATTNQACCACQPYGDGVYNEYLFWFLFSQREQFKKRGEGGAQPNISKEKIVSTLIPIPPLAEQQRICELIERLASKVENYAEIEKKLSEFESTFPATLKKSILQYAVEGKLVPQDPNDEPASVLVERIAEERKALVKAGKLKRDKSESVIFRGSDRLAYETRNGETVCIEDELPFKIPETWAWVRLGEISNYGQCVGTDNVPKGAWMLDLEDIEKGGRLLIKNRTRESKSTKHVFKKGQILYSKLRPYLRKVLVADEDGYCTSEIIPITFMGEINPLFAVLVLNSPYFVDYTLSCCCGVKMPRLTTGDARAAYFPLPPIAEQARIVSEVERLEKQVARLQ